VSQDPAHVLAPPNPMDPGQLVDGVVEAGGHQLLAAGRGIAIREHVAEGRAGDVLHHEERDGERSVVLGAHGVHAGRPQPEGVDQAQHGPLTQHVGAAPPGHAHRWQLQHEGLLPAVGPRGAEGVGDPGVAGEATEPVEGAGTLGVVGQPPSEQAGQDLGVVELVHVLSRRRR
jgi:hypothetical protein